MFYWKLSFCLILAIAVNEETVTAQNAKVQNEMDTNIVNRTTFLLPTIKMIKYRNEKKFWSNDTTDVSQPTTSQKYMEHKSKLKVARNDLISGNIASQTVNTHGANEIRYDGKHCDSKAIFKRSLNQNLRSFNGQYETEAPMDRAGLGYAHHRNHDHRLTRKKNSSRSYVERRRRKNVFSRMISRDSKEIDYPMVKNEKTIESDDIRNNAEVPIDHAARENYLKDNSVRGPDNQINLSVLHDLGKYNFTEIPWPIIPGPITCEVDYQLQPSFVAKLGEFDYVVSVERQDNPDEPAEHICTGVIYNRRFVIITPHCLKDNYGLSVTSTDDLCTIDEMIDVDYIIEHKYYDPETRQHDIALIKLKSEIHKKPAEFPNVDEALGTHFYAVGFGELMWKSFPTKVCKLLQKVPIMRYTRGFEEESGTLHVTTSHMDLTGSFRGDYGGALVNPRGEVVGLKSKFVKRATEYEVYTRVRDYLPWIKSMVALHGS